MVGVFAVFASGWPGFGGKVGGTIAMVPCFLLLALAVAGIRLNWRLVLLVAISGLALFAVFALISYLTPATGKSDIGSFAGSSLHGDSGGLLLRKMWAEVLTVIVTTSFIPLEIYELVVHRSWAKAAVIVVNVGVVLYLLRRLRREKHWPFHK